MKETVNIIAAMVGEAASHQNISASSNIKRSSSRPAPRKIASKPASKKVKKDQDNEDVFPLDEEDLKEF
jgi:hypothetical protein